MKSETLMYPELIEHGKKDDVIRVILLTSSRSNNAYKDEFTDFDVELFVESLDPFLESDR